MGSVGSARPNEARSTLSIPGVGQLTLDRQHVTRTSNSTTKIVNAIVLDVTANLPGVDKGARLVVGHSSAQLAKVTSLLRGEAYGTSIQLAGQVASAPTFRRWLACAGTDGKVLSNSGTGTTPSILKTSSALSQVAGTVASSVKGVTRSTVAKLNLLNKLIGAKVVVAQAGVRRNGPDQAPSLSTVGSRIVGLTVAGRHIAGGNIKPNTVIDLGVGKLILRDEIVTKNLVTVHMIDLTLSHALGHLAIGTEITVGTAIAGVSP